MQHCCIVEQNCTSSNFLINIINDNIHIDLTYHTGHDWVSKNKSSIWHRLAKRIKLSVRNIYWQISKPGSFSLHTHTHDSVFKSIKFCLHQQPNTKKSFSKILFVLFLIFLPTLKVDVIMMDYKSYASSKSPTDGKAQKI